MMRSIKLVKSLLIMSNLYTTFGKRLFDVLASFVGLICLMPMFLVLGVAVKLSSKGPIFYMQERMGKDFRPFNMFKFRSMVVNDSNEYSLVTTKQDGRITRIGGILRAYKLDELPQLMNVFKGDMSLVGPRPEVMRYINYYKADYKIILQVKPGITDNAAIAFKQEDVLLEKYDDPQVAYIEHIMPQKILLYKEYIRHYSFLGDVRLILKTIF